MNQHIRSNALTFDSPHTVALSLQDWLGIQTQLGFAALNNRLRGETATEAVTNELLERLTEQTMPAIDAAAEQEESAA